MRILAAVVLASSTATAAPIRIREAGDGTSFAVQPIPPTSATTVATSRTIYLNRGGGTLTPGNNNSQSNTSSLVDHATSIAGWDASDADWAETMACVRAMWSPFDVEITDQDPGTTPHFEVHIGGTPTAIDFPGGIGGVAPMALDCSIVERSIVFVFPNNLNNRPQRVCEVIGQEVGHSYGLDHELEPSDPMTYLSFNGDRTFRDKSVACGESTARPCGFEGHASCRDTQNSYALLLGRLGEPGSDHVSPTLTVVEPRDDAVVEPGFSVVANAADDVGVERITLFIDGGVVAVEDEALAIATDPRLAAGSHALVIEVIDTAGNTTTRTLTVRIGDDASSNPPPSDFVPTLGCSTTGAPGWPGLALAGVLARVRRSCGRGSRSAEPRRTMT